MIDRTPITVQLLSYTPIEDVCRALLEAQKNGVLPPVCTNSLQEGIKYLASQYSASLRGTGTMPNDENAREFIKNFWRDAACQ